MSSEFDGEEKLLRLKCVHPWNYEQWRIDAVLDRFLSDADECLDSSIVDEGSKGNRHEWIQLYSVQLWRSGWLCYCSLLLSTCGGVVDLLQEQAVWIDCVTGNG